MTILHPNPARVKPARKPFGFGIQVPKGPRQVGYNSEDAREWAEISDRLERERLRAEEEARIEAVAEDSARFQEYMAMAAYGPAEVLAAWDESELARVLGARLPEVLR